MQLNYPIWSVKAVQPQTDYTLIIDFKNGEKKLYDCKPLLNENIFKALKNQSLFLNAYVECGTVVWNDDLDIAPEELYYNGIPIE